MLQVSVNTSLEKFQLQKKRQELCKSYSWKKKKSIEKNGQVSKICKTMGTQMPAWKKTKKKERKMNKIAHDFLQKCFKFQ